LLIILVLSLAALPGGIPKMTMSLQTETVSAYRSPAPGAALFPSQRQIAPAPARVDNRLDVPLSELTFRHLQTPDEIAAITHLRKEISLVAAGVADPAFVTREKKETRRALSPLSSAAAPSSERFASFR
jgi:hypothetical protein